MKAARGNAFLDLSTSVELINGMSCAEERWYLIYCRYNYTYQLAMVLSGPLVNDEETATGVETVNHGGQKAISHERSTYTDLCFAIRKTDATC